MPRPIVIPRNPQKRLLYLIKGNLSKKGKLISSTQVVSSGNIPSGSTAPDTFVDSIAKLGDTQLKGDVTLSEGLGIDLTQSGQDIQISLNANLEDLVDVVIDSPSPADGDILVYDSLTGKWINQPNTSGGYDTIQEEGANLTQRSTLDFVGSALTASDTGVKTQVATHGLVNALASLGSNGIISKTGASSLAANSGTDTYIMVWSGTTTPSTSNWKVASSNFLLNQNATTASKVFGVNDAGDTNEKFYILGDGWMKWGSGSGAQDVELSRIAANVLGVSSGDSFRIGNYGEFAEASAPSTPASGFNRVYADSSERLLALDDLGNSRSLSGLVYRQTTVAASDTISNTTAKTAFGSTWSMPANSMKAGKVMRITSWGKFSTDALNAPRLCFYVTWNDAGGDVDLFTSNLFSLSTSIADGTWHFSVDIICSATDTLRVGGSGCLYDSLNLMTYPIVQTLAGNITADTDTATTVKIMAEMFINADVDNNVTMEGFHVELM